MVLSFDVSEYTTQAAKKYGGENWEVIQANAEAIPLPGSIDLVVSLEVLEHLPNPEIAIGEVFRILKPGSIFWASTPNPECNIPLYRHPERKDPTHISIKSPDEWRKLFTAEGFEMVTIETVLFVPYLWRKPLNLGFVISSGLWGPDTLLLGRKPDNNES